ncbi:MAG: hypothetical protein PVI59_13290 [Anaerolineae bacterium]|jgi:hypothetical protein
MMEPRDKDVQVYQIRLRGQLDEGFVASFCPPGTTLTHEEDATLLSSIETDQSGIMGLVRHLHNLGCTILGLQKL